MHLSHRRELRGTLLRTFLLCCSLWALAPVSRADDEPSPETKALLVKIRDEVKSKTAKVRTTAYASLGELGAKAKSERRLICEGMLDPNALVRTAAADALKKVDEPMHKIALGISIDKDVKQIEAARKLGKAGEPLIPLLATAANGFSAAGSHEAPADAAGHQKVMRARKDLENTVAALVAVGPEDPGVNAVVITMLKNPVGELRTSALDHIPLLKNKKLALAPVLGMVSNPKEQPKIRIHAAKLVPDLVDENTTPGAVKALEALRFEQKAEVREAVEAAIKKLK